MMNMLRATIWTRRSVESGRGDLEIKTLNWSSKEAWATGKSSVSMPVYSLPIKKRKVLMNLLFKSAALRVANSGSLVSD